MQMKITLSGNRKVDAHFRGFTVKTDQPQSGGGDNTAPMPFEFFLASIGTCAGIYIKGFCIQRNIPTDDIEIVLNTERGSEPGLLSKITMDIQVPDDFPKQYESALINVSNLCSVKKNMHKPPEFQITVNSA